MDEPCDRSALPGKESDVGAIACNMPSAKSRDDGGASPSALNPGAKIGSGRAQDGPQQGRAGRSGATLPPFAVSSAGRVVGWKSGPSGVIIRQNNSSRECLGAYSVDWSILIVRPVGDLSPCGAHLCLGWAAPSAVLRYRVDRHRDNPACHRTGRAKLPQRPAAHHSARVRQRDGEGASCGTVGPGIGLSR